MSSPSPSPPPASSPSSPPPSGPRNWWRLFMQMMLSPVGLLAPCVSCGAAVTSGHSFGGAGALFGALGGLVLGAALVVFWHVFVNDVFGEARRARFAEQMVNDAQEAHEARIERRLGKTDKGAPETAAIPLDGGPIDIDVGVGTAIARIDAHGDAAAALAAAERLRNRHPRDPRAIGALARCLLRAARPKEGAGLASKALHVAVLTGHHGSIGPLVGSFWAHREALSLEPGVSKAVANHLDTLDQHERAAYFRGGRASLV